MECKVCTKCNTEKEIQHFQEYKGKYKAICRPCTYALYHRKSHLKRLRAAGKVPRAEKPLKPKELKLQENNERRKRKRAELKAARPVTDKPVKEQKPKRIPLTPEERKQRRYESKKRYRASNPGKLTEEKKRYYHRIKNRPEVKIAKNLRKRLKEYLKQGVTIGSSKSMFGCTPDGLRQHIERQFQFGMTWDNYGEWHVDHIQPVCSFNLADSEERMKVNHYTNLRPLWAKDNIKKALEDKKLKFVGV